MELPGAFFGPSSKIILKNSPQENTSSNVSKFSNSNVKIFPPFSQEKAILIFQEAETLKKCLILYQEKVVLIFRETNPPSPPQKKFLIFQETKLYYISSDKNPKNLFIFPERIIDSEQNLL